MIDGLSPDLRKKVEFRLIGEVKTNEDVIRDMVRKIEDYDKNKPGKRSADNAFYANEMDSENEEEEYSGEVFEEEEKENAEGNYDEEGEDALNSII